MWQTSYLNTYMHKMLWINYYCILSVLYMNLLSLKILQKMLSDRTVFGWWEFREHGTCAINFSCGSNQGCVPLQATDHQRKQLNKNCQLTVSTAAASLHLMSGEAKLSFWEKLSEELWMWTSGSRFIHCVQHNNNCSSLAAVQSIKF